MICKKLFALIALMAISHQPPVIANANPTFELNGITAQDNNNFNIVGPDPYFIFSPLNDVEQPNYIVLNFKLEAAKRANNQIPMELFFKSPVNTKDHFDPFYKLKFNIDPLTIKDKGQRFALAIPKTLAFTSGDKMRLDLDDCQGCRIEMLDYPKLVSTPSTGTVIVEPYRMLDGLIAIDTTGRKLATLNWRLKDMNHSNNIHVVSGGDPYIISPTLDSETANLSGVYVELVAISNQQQRSNFQLFYATEFHGFIERASTFVSVKPSDYGAVKFVVPLDFLNSGIPKNKSIQRLRLDFPQDQLGSKWRIEEITLIHKEQMADFQELIPHRRLENKFQRPSKLGFIGQIITKITSDLGFTLGYLLLLLLTGFGFWRAFRR